MSSFYQLFSLNGIRCQGFFTEDMLVVFKHFHAAVVMCGMDCTNIHNIHIIVLCHLVIRIVSFGNRELSSKFLCSFK